MQELIDYLQSIADGQNPLYVNQGICNNIYYEFDTEAVSIFNKAVDNACKDWEHYSGLDDYPINGARDGESAVTAFYDSPNKYTGEYGRRRRELAGLVAEELRKCL